MEMDPMGHAWQASGAAGWERGRFGGPEAMAGAPPPLPAAWVSAGPQVSPGSPPHSIYPRLGGSSRALRCWCLQCVCSCSSSSPITTSRPQGSAVLLLQDLHGISYPRLQAKDLAGPSHAARQPVTEHDVGLVQSRVLRAELKHAAPGQGGIFCASSHHEACQNSH